MASIRALPFPPKWLNIKPSRFGTIENLFEVIEYCLDKGIRMYGGGPTELSIGQQHIHIIESLFYPADRTTPLHGGTMTPNRSPDSQRVPSDLN